MDGRKRRILRRSSSEKVEKYVGNLCARLALTDTIAEKKSKDVSTSTKPRPKPRPALPAPSMSAYRPAVSAEQESDFMSSLLGELDQVPTKVQPTKSRKRKPAPQYISDDDVSPGSSKFKSYQKRTPYMDLSSDGPVEDDLPPSEDDFTSPKKKIKIDDSVVTPAVEQLADLDVHGSSDFESFQFDDIDFNEPMDIDGDDSKPSVKEEIEPVIPKATTFNGNSVKPVKTEEDTKPAWLSVYDSLNVESQDSLGPITSSNLSNSADIAALEEDGSLRFFWIDYLELDGKIYFIGKLKDKKSGVWISCCVAVENMQRNLFCLPREKRHEQDEDGDITETDIVPTMEDVYSDFELIRKELKIKKWRGKIVKRKYAFGEKDVPRDETQWLKVVYGFNGNFCIGEVVNVLISAPEPPIPPKAESPNIARIFGTSTNAFELLVLKRKIMGPCWLQVKNPVVDNKGVSQIL